MRRPLLKGAYALYGLKWRLLRPITLGVRLMLVRDGTVLLICHSYQSLWTFPGGGVKRGETLLEAALREAREEVGAVVLDEPWLQGVYTNFQGGKSDHVALFVSESWRLEEPSDRWEIEGRALFALDALPPVENGTLQVRAWEYQAGLRGLNKVW